jgi:hypothetical protein
MSLADKLLNPKSIILNAIKSKLEGTGIEHILVVFNVLTDKYTILLTDKDDKRMNFDIDENEVSMIKKMFINKIIKKFKENSKTDIKSVIIKIAFVSGVDEGLLDVFIEDTNLQVTKLNY